jgi:hypothetical protein
MPTINALRYGSIDDGISYASEGRYVQVTNGAVTVYRILGSRVRVEWSGTVAEIRRDWRCVDVPTEDLRRTVHAAICRVLYAPPAPSVLRTTRGAVA